MEVLWKPSQTPGCTRPKVGFERKLGLITGEPNPSGLGPAKYMATGIVERSPPKDDAFRRSVHVHRPGGSETPWGAEKWALRWLQGKSRRRAVLAFDHFGHVGMRTCLLTARIDQLIDIYE